MRGRHPSTRYVTSKQKTMSLSASTQFIHSFIQLSLGAIRKNCVPPLEEPIFVHSNAVALEARPLVSTFHAEKGFFIVIAVFEPQRQRQ